MHPPARARRIFKWTGAVLALLLFLMWTASYFYFARASIGNIAIAVFWGRIDCEIYPRGRIPQFVSSVGVLPWNDAGNQSRGWPWTTGSTKPLHAFDIRLSFLLWGIAIPTAWLWHRDHRLISSSPDHRLCLRCGYDLTGNTIGVCPECGDKACPPAVLADSECGKAKPPCETVPEA